MNIGDQVKVTIDDVTYQGTIVNVYVCPKEWNVVDIKTSDDELLRGIKTEDATLI